MASSQQAIPQKGINRKQTPRPQLSTAANFNLPWKD